MTILSTKILYTQEEAKELLSHGAKLTHYSFSPEEWISQSNDMIVFEDGIRVDPAKFWGDRTGSRWQENWRVLSEGIGVDPDNPSMLKSKLDLILYLEINGIRQSLNRVPKEYPCFVMYTINDFNEKQPCFFYQGAHRVGDINE